MGYESDVLHIFICYPYSRVPQIYSNCYEDSTNSLSRCYASISPFSTYYAFYSSSSCSPTSSVLSKRSSGYSSLSYSTSGSINPSSLFLIAMKYSKGLVYLVYFCLYIILKLLKSSSRTPSGNSYLNLVISVSKAKKFFFTYSALSYRAV